MIDFYKIGYYLVLVLWLLRELSRLEFWRKLMIKRRIRKNIRNYEKRMIDLRVKEEKN